jgi:hypothetical protein
MSAVQAVEDEVRELVRRRGLGPVVDSSAVRRLVEDVVSDYDDRPLTSSLPPLPDLRSAARAVYDAVAGFGPLQRHLDDPTVEEIWIDKTAAGFGSGVTLESADALLRFRPEEVVHRIARRPPLLAHGGSTELLLLEDSGHTEWMFDEHPTCHPLMRRVAAFFLEAVGKGGG